MANYTIVGGDGKQYGPISEGDLRKWIAEGRLNAQSLAKAESDAEFRPLGTFPELADAFAPVTAPPSIAPVAAVGGGGDRNAALDRVRVPAIGLMITAIISMIFVLIELLAPALVLRLLLKPLVPILQQQGNNPQAQQLIDQMNNASVGPVGIASGIFQLIIGILIFIGASRMIKLRSYEFSIAAAIMSLIPCVTTSCCASPLGLIFGIWALVVLGKAKPHFS